MANFNVNFGQNVISNAQKNRQLELEQQRINNAREASAASAANQASATFWSRVNAEEKNANRKKELELREKKQDKDLAWEDAVKKQELAEREARFDMLRKQSAKYDMAYETDRVKAEEEVAQAKERADLLNGELGTLYLSAQKHGGRVTPSQIAAFNEATDSQYDFVGNTMTFQGRDGSMHTETIGDGTSFYMGQYRRDTKGNIVYGKDGTPMTQMVEMPRQMQHAIISSAYGKEFVNRRGGATVGMSTERLQLERERLAQRKSEEEGRNSRAGTKNDAANSRLAVSVAKNMNDIKRGLKLNDVQAAKFQSSLTKILSDAFGDGQGGIETEPSSDGEAGAYDPNAKYAPGDTVIRNDKTYKMGADGKFHLVM